MNSLMKVCAAVDHTFQWRGAGGERWYKPQDMATSHLMNTLVMIWNHNMPEDAKIKPYIKHEFGPYYTDKYMKSAIRQLAIELSTRSLNGAQRAKLDHMLGWLGRLQLAEGLPKRSLK